ncbi:MAG TPA: CBS domain-containing protein [Nitrososphaerales archaeon]|nr:CBS domain-containing protein [Nitrososphaerales archaeon]
MINLVLVAKDIVERELVSLKEETTASDAAKVMKQNHKGFALVVSSSGDPVGIVTEWDFLSQIISEQKNPGEVKLKEIMSRNLVTVSSKDGIDVIAKLMADRGVRRVLVTENGKIIGAVTSKTILRRFEDYINNISAQIARLQTPIF